MKTLNPLLALFRSACLVFALLSIVLSANASAQEAKPYKDGPVTEVSYIKTRNGKFDDYMKFLDTDWKSQMEGYKKAGLIVGYAVYSATPRSPNEADVILTTTYANLAALDKTDEFDKIDAKAAGGTTAMNKGASDRDAIRQVLGSELIREMILK